MDGVQVRGNMCISFLKLPLKMYLKMTNLNKNNIFAHSSGGYKSKIKVISQTRLSLKVLDKNPSLILFSFWWLLQCLVILGL